MQEKNLTPCRKLVNDKDFKVRFQLQSQFNNCFNNSNCLNNVSIAKVSLTSCGSLTLFQGAMTIELQIYFSMDIE